MMEEERRVKGAVGKLISDVVTHFVVDLWLKEATRAIRLDRRRCRTRRIRQLQHRRRFRRRWHYRGGS